MGKHLVLVGGGHAHMVTLANLHRIIGAGHSVTVVGPSDFHYYSGMGPGMLGQFYTPGQIRFATRKVVEKQGGKFLRAKVTHIDPGEQRVFADNGETLRYDLISFNSGSFVQSPMVARAGPALHTAKPIEKLITARQQIMALSSRQYLKVAVVGGGAAAVEIAGNTGRLLNRHNRHGFEVHLFTQGRILNRFPWRVRLKALAALQQQGLRVHENHKALHIDGCRIDFDTGKHADADVVLLASGVAPSPIFNVSGLPTGPDGGLRVNAFLQSTGYPNIFGGGDCIYFTPRPLEKLGVYAVRQNPVLYHNLSAALAGADLKTFSPGGACLLILNLGAGNGLFHKRGITFQGRPAFWIKDFIDRRFMRKFQAME